MGFSTATKYSECQDEHHDLSSTIQGGGNNVVVLDEEDWIVLSDIPLRNETQREVHSDRRVDANKEVTHIPEDDGQVNVSPEDMGPVSVDEPEGQRNGKADEIG